jgi:hypothetical protein
MRLDAAFLVEKAVKKLDVSTGYVERTADSEPYYFAKVEDLGLECSDFTEEAAVKTVLEEATFVLHQKLSLAKDILNQKR